MFVGVGAARVRDLFSQAETEGAVHHLHRRARRARPRARAEPDGIARGARADAQPAAGRDGRLRFAQGDHHHGARPTGPEVLDPALLRPGRFDRQVLVDKPDVKGREEVLRIHTKQVKLAPAVDLRVVAARTAGFAGADLANLVNEAALLAARKDKTAVEMPDFDEAIDRLIAGLEKKRVMSTQGARDRRLPRVGPRDRRDGDSGHGSGAQDLDRAARLRRARLHDAAAARGSLPDAAEGSARISSPCCSAAARPRRSRSARSRPARRTICSAPPTSRARWSPNGA